jgi:hypothetical protein
MDNLSQKEMSKNNERETTCRVLSDRESLRLFRLIKRTILETMLQSSLEKLKTIQTGFAEVATLKDFDLDMSTAAEVMEKKRLREPKEPLPRESDDE